ncbi:GHKL domain-containing protein [Breznakia sp. OttesenSCG-928-G09]|nr:GHKL domain-containing protein [Breznakia sp. OttesenSCG-928-G09]
MQKLFSASIFAFVLLCSQGITNSIYALSSQFSFYEMFQTKINVHPHIPLVGIVFSIIVFLLSIWICPPKKITQTIENKYTMSVITSAVFIFFVFLDIMTLIYYIDYSILIIPGYHLALSIIFLFSYLALFFYLVNLDTVERIQSKNVILENQLVTQREYYKKNMEYITALRKIKHDYFNLLHSLEYAFIDYSKEELENMIEELLKKTKKIDEEFTQYSNHPLVDSIILDASSLCKTKGINLTSLVSIPDDLPFDEDDLCIVFATLLNTAISLAERTNVEDKTISLTSKIRPGWFMINCEIKTNEIQEAADNHLANSEFKLVREIVDNNSGFVETKKDTNLYKIQVCITK